MGKEGKYDLKLADPPPMTETDSEMSESEVNETTNPVIENNDSYESVLPSKLIRSAVVQLLKYVSIVIGLEAQHLPKSAALNFSSCLRMIIEKGQEKKRPFFSLEDSTIIDEQTLLAMDQCSSWATLGFLRSVSYSPTFCKLLSNSSWVNLLLRMVEAKGHNEENNISTQILALRLLSTILPHSELNANQLAMIQERLFKLLGKDSTHF